MKPLHEIKKDCENFGHCWICDDNCENCRFYRNAKTPKQMHFEGYMGLL